MDDERKKEAPEQNECVIHTHPVPPGELGRYSVDGDPHSEMDIASYVEIEAPDENVQHERHGCQAYTVDNKAICITEICAGLRFVSKVA